MKMSRFSVRETVIATLGDFIREWGLDAEITPETKIVGDLEFDSIDVIQFTVALECVFGGGKIGFQDLLMQNGRYVEDLSVAQFQEFLETRLATT